MANNIYIMNKRTEKIQNVIRKVSFQSEKMNLLEEGDEEDEDKLPKSVKSFMHVNLV